MTHAVHIGKAATLAGVSVDTIRFYQKLGLIEGANRTESGYRLFDESQVHDLKFVRHAQELGFSLAEVKELLSFVIWEPVLPTDFSAPSTAALARIPDLRVAQYWDRQRVLSHLLGEHERKNVVWDYIAVYAPGTIWEDAPPKPAYSSYPVRNVIGDAKAEIQRLLLSAGSSSTGE